MKRKEFNSQLRDLSVQDLELKLESLRRDLFTLRLNATTAHVKDYSQFKKLRSNIASVLTHIRQRQEQ